MVYSGRFKVKGGGGKRGQARKEKRFCGGRTKKRNEQNRSELGRYNLYFWKRITMRVYEKELLLRCHCY